MKPPARWICVFSVVAAATTMACERDLHGPDDPLVPPLHQIVISDGVSFAAMTANQTIGGAEGVDTPSSLAFVSMLPGTLPAGSTVRITGPTGSSRTLTVFEGGFDPVPLAAAAGDVLTVEVAVGPSAPAMFSDHVPEDVPPIIVRTSPIRRRTGVPLNLLPTVYFSEPMDRSTITAGTISLTRDGTPVTGTVTVDGTGTVVTFRPNVPFAPDTWYVLHVGGTVQDLSGTSLAQAVNVEFQTGTGTIGLVQLCPDTLQLPVGTSSAFAVLVDFGQRVINHFPDSSLTWGSTDSSFVIVDPVGSVNAMAIGQAYATVTYQGVTDSALVVVGPWPPPGPFRVYPDGASLALGSSVPFVVSHPTGTPAPTVQWSSSDPAVVTVDQSGRATSMGGGTAFVFARAGADIDSADVEVIEPDWNALGPFIAYGYPRQFQVGETAPFGTTIYNIGDARPAWRSTDPDVMSVDETGIVTATGTGTAMIIADLFRLSDTVGVRVLTADEAGSVTVTPDEATVNIGQPAQFTATVDSIAGANGEPGIWLRASVDGGMFTVDQTGLGRGAVSGTALVIYRKGAAADTAVVHIR